MREEILEGNSGKSRRTVGQFDLCFCLVCVVCMDSMEQVLCVSIHEVKYIKYETNKMLIHSQLTSIQAAHQLSTRQFWKHQVEDSDNADHYFHRSW